MTTSVKSKTLNAVLDYADTNISYDISKELRASRAEENHLSELKKVIKATVNPFSKQINKDFLFDIKINRQASKNVQKHLLPLFKCGEEKRDVFISECSSTSEQFI